ncbi:erkA, partial [Symbiodinium necroappetens]
DQSPPSIRGRDITLTLRLLSGREVHISINEDATMAELRRYIEKTLALPAHLTRLYLGQDQVNSGYDSTLAQAGIEDEGVLTVVSVASEEFEEVTLEGFGQQLLPARLRKVKLSGACAFWRHYTFRDALLGDKISIRCVKQAFSDEEWAGNLVKEIYLLQHFKHENILKLLDVPPAFEDFNDICIMVEHMDIDLASVLRSSQELTEEHCQYLTYQILRALSYMHSAGVIHHQLKPRVVMVNKNCHVKLTDFLDALPANAVHFDDGDHNRWYRAPELILNQDWTALKLSGACDAWSVGCILAEMYRRKPLLPSRDAITHVQSILKLLGAPREEEMEWVTNQKARDFVAGCTLPTSGPDAWTASLGASEAAQDLLRRLVVFDPRRRCTCQEALQES